MLEPALTTKELGLRSTVSSIGETTSIAPLTRVSGVNSDNLTAFGFGLVFEEAFELREAPRVKSSFGFSARGFASSSDVRKVFDNDGCSRLNILEDRGRDNVVAIAPETLFASRKASQMPIGGLGTVRLKITPEAECSFDNFSPVAFAVESVVGSNGRAGDTEIDAEGFTVVDELNIRQLNNNVKVESTFAVDEISCGRGIPKSVLSITRKDKRYLESTVCGGQVDDALIPINFECVEIISGRTGAGPRTRYLSTFLGASHGRLYGLSCFLSGLHMQIRYKIRKCVLTVSVRKSVKCIGIALSLIPTYTTYCIERFCELLDSLKQRITFFGCRFESQYNCSIHRDIIPYVAKKMQIRKWDTAIPLHA